jgi:hypothetical protein
MSCRGRRVQDRNRHLALGITIVLYLNAIMTDDVLATEVGTSPANTNNAFRTLRRMLKKAKEWDLIAAIYRKFVIL